MVQIILLHYSEEGIIGLNVSKCWYWNRCEYFLALIIVGV